MCKRTRTRAGATTLAVATGVLAAVALGAPAAGAQAMITARGLEPAPREAGAVADLVARIGATMRWSRYAHETRVDARQGRFEFDCSGMVAWVLARAAPVAHRAVVTRAQDGRPLARDYYRQVVDTPASRVVRGWRRVARVGDAREGDVLAWLRPAVVRSQNTGHVAFIMAPPEPLDGVAGAYLVRVADASSYQHQDDTRAGTGMTGFGYGTILVMADPATGAPRAYGWVGRFSAWVLAAQMAIGRPSE